MKKTTTLVFLLALFFNDVSGQWYEKKYNVSDINFLTREQLWEAKKDANNGLYISLAVAGLGGVVILLERLIPYSLEDEEDPTFFEQLLGDKGMHIVITGAGIGLAGGGAIGSLVYLGRSGTIKSAINRNYPDSGSLTISPAILLEKYSHSVSPGFTLVYRF